MYRRAPHGVGASVAALCQPVLHTPAILEGSTFKPAFRECIATHACQNPMARDA